MNILLQYFILSFLSISYGWILDSSCDAGGYRELIIEGMNDAFDQAAAAVESFAIGPGASDAVWQARRDLISYLFNPALTNGNVDGTNTDCEFGKLDRAPIERTAMYHTRRS